MILQHNFFTAQLPDGWEDASQVIILGPEDGGFRPNMIFSQEPARPGETTSEFAARQLPDLRRVLTGYDIVAEGPARFGPNIGFLREQTFSMDKSDMAQLQFFIVIDDRVYGFTFTHLKEWMPKLRAVAERLFSNARLNPQRAQSSAGDVAEF